MCEEKRNPKVTCDLWEHEWHDRAVHYISNIPKSDKLKTSWEVLLMWPKTPLDLAMRPEKEVASRAKLPLDHPQSTTVWH